MRAFSRRAPRGHTGRISFRHLKASGVKNLLCAGRTDGASSANMVSLIMFMVIRKEWIVPGDWTWFLCLFRRPNGY